MSNLQLKTQNFLARFWPTLFVIGVWFVFASPYFLQGRVPYASNYQVNFFKPWSHYEQFWGPVKNNAMPDVHTQIYPWKKFTIDTYRSEQVPLWNPYNFSGNPHLANFQSAVLSPFNLLFFTLPFIDAWSILVLLQPLLAGLFMYLFVREIGVSRVGSLISSIAFMFCGFMVVWMAYGTLGYAILYLPLALFAIEKYVNSHKLRFLFLLAFTVPLSFFSGHFQISLYFLAGLVSYVIFKGIATKNIRNTFYFILFTCFGLLLSMSQLAPSIKLYLYSVRSELFQLSEAIPFKYFITSIAPDFFGNPVTRNDWFGHYAEWASFVGIWPFLLAVYTMLRIRSQTILFFSMLGLGSLAFAVNSQLASLLVSLKIPVLSTSALSRIIVLFSFSFAVLAGFGFDKLREDLEKTKAKRTIINFLVTVAIVFAAVWLLILVGKVYPEEWLIVAKRNFILPTMLFGAGSLLILLNIFVKYKKLVLLISVFLLLVSAFDSLRFAQKWMPFDPRGLVYPAVAVVDATKAHAGQGRVFGNIGTEVSSYYGVQTVDGYDPLYIKRYGEFIRGASAGQLLEAERSVAKLDRVGKYTDRTLDLLGVSLIFHPIIDTNQGWAYPVWVDKERYSLVYRDEKFELYRNNFVLPRASLFYNYEAIRDDEDILKRFYSEAFDFRNKLILEEKPVEDIKEGAGNARIISYTPNKITIDVTTTTPAFLFLADNYYSGWKAKVNGLESKIYRADYTFRAVVVPKGRSIVEFIYEGWYF